MTTIYGVSREVWRAAVARELARLDQEDRAENLRTAADGDVTPDDWWRPGTHWSDFNEPVPITDKAIRYIGEFPRYWGPRNPYWRKTHQAGAISVRRWFRQWRGQEMRRLLSEATVLCGGAAPHLRPDDDRGPTLPRDEWFSTWTLFDTQRLVDRTCQADQWGYITIWGSNGYWSGTRTRGALWADEVGVETENYVRGLLRERQTKALLCGDWDRAAERSEVDNHRPWCRSRELEPLGQFSPSKCNCDARLVGERDGGLFGLKRSSSPAFASRLSRRWER